MHKYLFALVLLMPNASRCAPRTREVPVIDHGGYSAMCGEKQEYAHTAGSDLLQMRSWTRLSALCGYYREHSNATVMSQGFSCHQCPKRSFWCVFTMQCRKVLDCDEISNFIKLHPSQAHAAEGGVKQIWHSSWGSLQVAVARGKSHTREDFFAGVDALSELSSSMSPYVVPLIGEYFTADLIR